MTRGKAIEKALKLYQSVQLCVCICVCVFVCAHMAMSTVDAKAFSIQKARAVTGRICINIHSRIFTTWSSRKNPEKREYLRQQP